MSAVCDADDIILVSESKSGLEKMLADIVRVFGEVGLEVSLPKCHWTSYPAKRHATLKCATNRLAWEPSLVFVGAVLDVERRGHPKFLTNGVQFCNRLGHR